jgi:hypothetical protein
MDILVDVVGYEGLYKINKNGDVWSCRTNKFISVHYDKDGYKIVSLKGCKKLHRLLAINFIPNPDNHPLIDHIDRVKTNNNLDNLRWVSVAENCKNRNTPPNNKLGYKNISVKVASYYLQLYNGDVRINMSFAKSKYTLEQVIAIRNQKYIEFGLEICD